MSAVADRILTTFERNVLVTARSYGQNWDAVARVLRTQPQLCEDAFRSARRKLERNLARGGPMPQPVPPPREAPMAAQPEEVARSATDVIAAAITELEQRRQQLTRALDHLSSRTGAMRAELRELDRSLGALRRAGGQRALPAGDAPPRWPVPDNARAAILDRLAAGPARADVLGETVGALVGPRLYSWLKQLAADGQVVKGDDGQYVLPAAVAA